LIETISKGIFTGTILTMSFGAGFFALIQTSINRGVKQGLLIALGTLLSDIFIFSFAFLPLALFHKNCKNWKMK
jgi:threonine/homoserine/homoserine lactone efflux protein